MGDVASSVFEISHARAGVTDCKDTALLTAVSWEGRRVFGGWLLCRLAGAESLEPADDVGMSVPVLTEHAASRPRPVLSLIHI